MAFELAAITEPGRRLDALAWRLAEQLAERAAAHDREASYPHESADALKASGFTPRRCPPRSAAWASSPCTT